MVSVNAKAGWFSKRHQTNEAHLKARAIREARVQEQMEAFEEREEAARKRTPQEQLKRLNDMFGVGQGAKKERAKLARRIAAQKQKKGE